MELSGTIQAHAIRRLGDIYPETGGSGLDLRCVLWCGKIHPP
jgi:hypothetical protein